MRQKSTHDHKHFLTHKHTHQINEMLIQNAKHNVNSLVYFKVNENERHIQQQLKTKQKNPTTTKMKHLI